MSVLINNYLCLSSIDNDKLIIVFPVGLGRGLVEHYLSLTGFTVIAAVRDTKHENCSSLKDIPREPQSKLVIIKIDNTSPLDAKYSMEILQKEFGIFHIDILIANAGICEHLVPLKDVQMAQINQNLVVNTWSLLHLYQAALPMLMRSSQPKLVYISSVLGSISLAAKNTGWTGPYGLSKAAANFLIQKIGSESNGLIAMAIDPG